MQACPGQHQDPAGGRWELHPLLKWGDLYNKLQEGQQGNMQSGMDLKPHLKRHRQTLEAWPDMLKALMGDPLAKVHRVTARCTPACCQRAANSLTAPTS